MFARASTAVIPADRHIPRPRARLAAVPGPALRDPHRHPSRHGLGQVRRRDPRRFGRGISRSHAPLQTAVSRPSDALRQFAHTFSAAFLFVTVFLA